MFAELYVSLGEQGEALARLEKTGQDRSVWLIWVKINPRFDNLRDDPNARPSYGVRTLPL